jgi:hypothetical protein
VIDTEEYEMKLEQQSSDEKTLLGEETYFFVLQASGKNINSQVQTEKVARYNDQTWERLATNPAYPI